MKKPQHISGTIKEVFENLSASEEAGPGKKDDIYYKWEKAAGKTAARHSSPAGLKDKILTVNVDSTVWIYQLRLKEASILRKIGNSFKGHEIEKIRFRSGEVEK